MGQKSEIKQCYRQKLHVRDDFKKTTTAKLGNLSQQGTLEKGGLFPKSQIPKITVFPYKVIFLILFMCTGFDIPLDNLL